MAENEALHKRLIARQSDAELERKALKARATLWTQEEIDWIHRQADRMVEFFNSADTAMKHF